MAGGLQPRFAAFGVLPEYIFSRPSIDGPARLRHVESEYPFDENRIVRLTLCRELHDCDRCNDEHRYPYFRCYLYQEAERRAILIFGDHVALGFLMRTLRFWYAKRQRRLRRRRETPELIDADCAKRYTKALEDEVDRLDPEIASGDIETSLHAPAA